MQPTMPKILAAATTAALFSVSLLLAGAATAQERYPAKPVRVIVPVPAGSLTDTIARAANQALTDRMGQSFIVDTRVGANMILGTEACARAPADGLTLCMISSANMSFNPHTFSKLPYDPAKDFKPIARHYINIDAIIASASTPVSSIKELQALATAKPGSMNFATVGEGSGSDLFRQWLQDHWKTKIAGIPYKTNIVTALLAQEVHFTRLGMGNVAGLLGTGKIKVLAHSASSRLARAPDIPTMDEAGIGGYTSKVWWGIAAPSATPDAIVNALNAEFVRMFREPKFAELLTSNFVEAAVNTPQEFAAFLAEDRANAGRLVRQYNVPVQ
jgi:tripartite-type tricarboxylate transporter receptor subunit TctC